MGAFHAYDIRGIYGQDIGPELAYRVGRACARFTGARTVLIGHDARLHSRELYDRASAGLADEGCAVIAIGLASTPEMHYAQIKAGCDLGIMVTASHNPKEYHGFKVFDKTGGSISQAKGLDRIEAMVQEPPVAPAAVRGTIREVARAHDYIDWLASRAEGRVSLPVVIDPANGSSGHVFQALVERLKLPAEFINAEPDGNFPGHDPNPLKEQSRVQIAQRVVASGAACGVLLDGDGDRIIFIDEQGRACENYFVSALIAEELLRDRPGAAIVYDLISSRVLPERIRELGGRPVEAKVGYTHLYDEMVGTGAVFGAEASGHVYFRVEGGYYTESAACAMLCVLSLLERRQTTLSALLAPLRSRYFQAEELNLSVRNKTAALAAIEKNFHDGTITRRDGISVAYPDFWFNVRPSNTEPLLRVRLEAVNEAAAVTPLARIRGLLAG